MKSDKTFINQNVRKMLDRQIGRQRQQQRAHKGSETRCASSTRARVKNRASCMCARRQVVGKEYGKHSHSPAQHTFHINGQDAKNTPHQFTRDTRARSQVKNRASACAGIHAGVRTHTYIQAAQAGEKRYLCVRARAQVRATSSAARHSSGDLSQ